MTTGATGSGGPGGEPEEPGAEGPVWQRPYARWLAAALAAMAGFALVVALLQSDEHTVAGTDPTPSATATPSASASPSASPTPSPSATASEQASPGPTGSPAASPTGAAPGAVDRSTAVWPVEGSDVSYADPVSAAGGFATDFVGFTAPVVGEFQQGDARSGEVEVRPRADGPVTTVLVRQLSGEDTWSVLGAVTASIELTEPATSAVISSPVTVRGSALAFEGTVVVQVREDGRREPLGEGFVTGGGDVMRPFEGTVDFAPPSQERGALVLLTESAEDGQVWEAAVVRVGLEQAGR
jgi:hypothetical protein